jgi:hypothetical protein
LSDLRRLLAVDGNVLVYGANTPPILRTSDNEWIVLEHCPLPLSGLFLSTERAIFASGPKGLFRSSDLGTSWDQLVAGPDGQVGQMTFLLDGRGWAGVTPDNALLRTEDGGRTWERLPAPFGVLPVIALLAVPGPANRAIPTLTAATYDNRQQTVCLWRSDDGGARWVRGADSSTPWPVVATCAMPPLVAIGNTITVRSIDGPWHQTAIGETGIRRVVGYEESLIALGIERLWRSEDVGLTWVRDDLQLPIDQVVDIAADSSGISVLLSGQRLWSRRL